MVRVSQAGEILTYEALQAALSAGSDRAYTRQDVQHAVQASKKRLCKELARTLTAVPGVGYRVPRGGEHTMISNNHSRKAERQLVTGVRLLEHLREDECTPSELQLARGTLLIASALAQNQRLMWRKTRALEKALGTLTARVDAIAPDGTTAAS